MNELQKKLARRRCLNGEDGSAPAESPPAVGSSTDSSRDVPKLESRKSVNFSKKDPAPSSASGVDELQRKLARRRTANGESVNDSSVPVTGSTFDVKRETSTSSVSSEVSSLQNLPEVEDTSQDSQLGKQPSIESLPPVEEEGSDANGAVSTAAAEDAAHSVVGATERAVEQEPTEPVEVAEEKQPPSAQLESSFPHTSDNDSLGTAGVGSTDVAATATAADALAASSEPTDVDDSAVSVTVESTDSEGHKEEKAHATDQEAAPVAPITTTTSVTSEIFKAAEEMMNMVDQELDSFLQSHTTSAPASQPAIPLGRSKKPSSDLFDDDDSSLFATSEASDAALTALVDAVPVGLKSLRQPLSTSPVRSRLLSSSGQPPVVDRTGPVESLPAPSSSPNPRRAALARSTSGGPVVTTQPPLVPRQLSPPPTPKAEPVLRSLSPAPSTSAADLSALVSSPSGSKRVTPSSSSKASRGSAPTTPNGAGEKWYPGKYLLGGRWGGVRHKMEMMNSEQAQSLYNDLIASGDKPAQHKSRQGSISGTPSSLAVAATATATATAAATETAAAVATGDSSTASLLAENHRLKQEITRLRRLLDEKQAVIDAYELSESLRSGSSGGGVGVGGAIRTARAAVDVTPSLVAGEADAYGDDNDDDDGADSGFEDDALFGSANAHRRNAAATRRYPDLTSLESLLEPSSSATAIGSGVTGDDGLTALLTSDRDVAHFNPRTLGNEADLVRSYNYSTAGRVTDGPGSGHALADGSGEGGDSSGGSSGEGGAGDEEPPALPYESFLQLFAKSADLQFMTKAFILSVLGPHGDASPPVGKKDKLGYIFYGTHKLDERCRQFFDDLEARLVRDVAFRVLQTEDELICARDGLEQYVLHRIGQHAYKLTETVDEDRQLMRRMQILSTFITPAHLEIPPAYFEEEMLRQAGRELKAINNFRTPGDKVACIVKCVTVIFRSLAVARKRQEEKLYLEQLAAKQHAQDPEDTAVSPSGANSPHSTAAPATATATAAAAAAAATAAATATAAAHGESSSPSGETAVPSVASEATKRDDEGGERLEAGDGEGEENERGEVDDDEEDEEEAKPKLALAGADDFLPLFIWVVLQSKIPRLVSNAEYIHAYLNPKRLMGKSGYCLINLRSAIDFVTYVEASSLKIDPEYFAAQVAAVEATLPADDDDDA